MTCSDLGFCLFNFQIHFSTQEQNRNLNTGFHLNAFMSRQISQQMKKATLFYLMQKSHKYDPQDQQQPWIHHVELFNRLLCHVEWEFTTQRSRPRATNANNLRSYQHMKRFCQKTIERPKAAKHTLIGQ